MRDTTFAQRMLLLLGGSFALKQFCHGILVLDDFLALFSGLCLLTAAYYAGGMATELHRKGRGFFQLQPGPPYDEVVAAIWVANVFWVRSHPPDVTVLEHGWVLALNVVIACRAACLMWMEGRRRDAEAASKKRN